MSDNLSAKEECTEYKDQRVTNNNETNLTNDFDYIDDYSKFIGFLEWPPY